MPAACAVWFRLTLVALLLAASGASATEPTRACTTLEQGLAANVIPATSTRLRIVDGVVTEIVLRLANGRETRTELTPLRPGLSFRQILAPAPAAADAFFTTFNLATLEPGGTVLAETWMRLSNVPEGPRHSWMRFRCSAG